MGEEVTRSVDTLMVRDQDKIVIVHLVNTIQFQDVDPALASSLRRVQRYANAQAEIKADLTLVCLCNATIKTDYISNDFSDPKGERECLGINHDQRCYTARFIPGLYITWIRHRINGEFPITLTLT